MLSLLRPKHHTGLIRETFGSNLDAEAEGPVAGLCLAAASGDRPLGRASSDSCCPFGKGLLPSRTQYKCVNGDIFNNQQKCFFETKLVIDSLYVRSLHHSTREHSPLGEASLYGWSPV